MVLHNINCVSIFVCRYFCCIMKLSSIVVYGLRVGDERKLLPAMFRSFSYVRRCAEIYAKSRGVDVRVIRFFAFPHNPCYVERCVLLIPKDWHTPFSSDNLDDLPF